MFLINILFLFFISKKSIQNNIKAKEENFEDSFTPAKTNAEKNSIKLNRNLENGIEIIWVTLDFVSAYDLKYNSNNKWEFLLEINNVEPLSIGSKYIIDILYNSISEIANCAVISNYVLQCSPDKENQSKFDLVKINYIKSDKSTVTWNNLTSIYEIPINTKLEYTRLYDLTLIEKKYHFKIALKENLLPENALVKVDILYSKKEYNTSTCYNKEQVLSCIVDKPKQSTGKLIQLSTIQKYGSIEWENDKIYDYIEYIITLKYQNSYNLRFTDNKWNFILKASGSVTIADSTLVAINIKYGPEKKIGIAKCFYNDYNSNYQCEAEYSNQNINDLILIANTQERISTIWNNTDDENSITRLASLNFVKVYDLQYSSKKWSFKIEVEEFLPENTKVKVDIIYATSGSDSATCFYSNKILSCIRDDSSQTSTQLIRLKKELKYGSVTWLNIKEKSLYIPLNCNLTFSKSYGLFFTDVWNFIIEATSSGISIPSGSLVYIDILQNSNTIKGSCFIDGGSKGKISVLTCSSIGETQSKTDVIKINPNKIYSSVTWGLLTNSNNNIESAKFSSISLSFIDAYDMVFSNNTWLFTIEGKPTSNIAAGNYYTIDIKYIATNGVFDSTATCWTNGGSKSNGIIFNCKADYTEQNENDLVQIKYPKTDSTSVTWTTGVKDNFQITLKTSLTLVYGYDLYFDGKWKFKIKVKDGLLPAGAKVIVDIYISNTQKYNRVNCTSLNNNVIICNSTITTSSSRLQLTDEKSEYSSVEWKSNLQNDYLMFVKSDLTFYSVDNIYFDESEKKWIFMISYNNLPENSKVIIDVLYDNNPSLATCYVFSKLICSIENITQEKTKLVKLSHIKTENSTITWKNLYEDKLFYLDCNLTYLKSENLIYEDSRWKFDVYVSYEEIPNYSKVKIDLNINSSSYYNGIAYCDLIDNLLKCESFEDEYSLISLKTNKTSLSTVNWINSEEIAENINLNIFASISFVSGKIIKYNDEYNIYLKYKDTVIPVAGTVSVDILINDNPQTIICSGKKNYVLLCNINQAYSNDSLIYLSETKTSESTITWLDLNENVLLITDENEIYEDSSSFTEDYNNDYNNDDNNGNNYSNDNNGNNYSNDNNNNNNGDYDDNYYNNNNDDSDNFDVEDDNSSKYLQLFSHLIILLAFIF